VTDRSRQFRRIAGDPPSQDQPALVRNGPITAASMVRSSTAIEATSARHGAGTPLNDPMPMRVVVGFAASTTP
jgi:hypothetical protein